MSERANRAESAYAAEIRDASAAFIRIHAEELRSVASGYAAIGEVTASKRATMMSLFVGRAAELLRADGVSPSFGGSVE